jgi:hypothetical protein
MRMADNGVVMADRPPLMAAEAGFDRERRRRALSSIAARLRSEPDDVSVMLPFEEVVAALGRRAESDLGLQKIPLDTIVGTVDRRVSSFDRTFRPVSEESRGRWERVAAARRQGLELPPIDVYRNRRPPLRPGRSPPLGRLVHVERVAGREERDPRTGRLVVGAGGILFAAPLLMILFRQKYPRWWFDWNLELTRFSSQVSPYAALLDDR